MGTLASPWPAVDVSHQGRRKRPYAIQTSLTPTLSLMIELRSPKPRQDAPRFPNRGGMAHSFSGGKGSSPPLPGTPYVTA